MISHHPSKLGGNENCDGQNVIVSFLSRGPARQREQRSGSFKGRSLLTLFKMDLFQGCLRMLGKKGLLPKISHTYPEMTKLSNV